MKYRKDKYGNDLSVLGYGCMRFPKKHGKIVMDTAERLLCRAVEQGINYFDTAYIPIFPSAKTERCAFWKSKGSLWKPMVSAPSLTLPPSEGHAICRDSQKR